MGRVIDPPYWAVAALALATALSLHAAKNPDKVEKPTRAEKIERKMERALAEPAQSAPARPVMAAPADRPGRTNGNRPNRSNTNEERAAGPASPADPKFDGFRLIAERNIFNPNRVGRIRPGSEEKAVRVDTIALVGTMHYQKGVVAFFDSPDAAFRKTLRAGQSVGEFKVKSIAADGVELERDGQPLALKVAQQLRRVEGGEWSVSAVEPAASSEAAAAAADAMPAPPPIPVNASETLRRLMEQRQKQLKQ